MTEQTRPQLVYIIDDDEAVRDSIGMLLDSADLAYSSFAGAEDFLAAYDDSQRGCWARARPLACTKKSTPNAIRDIGAMNPRSMPPSKPMIVRTALYYNMVMARPTPTRAAAQ